MNNFFRLTGIYMEINIDSEQNVTKKNIHQPFASLVDA